MEHTRADLAGLRCDVLDDDAGVREVICGILARAGIAHRSFARLDELLEGIQARHPDLLFLDVRLAEANAVDAVRQLHALGYRGQIQIVSGMAPERLADIYRMAERYGYRSLYPIAKPFRSAAIKAAMQHVWQGLAPAAAVAADPPARIVAGWVTAPADHCRALVVQPQLFAQQQTDLFAEPDMLARVIADIVVAAGQQRQAIAPEIWLHMALDTALGLSLAALSATPDGLGAAALTVLVPFEQATRSPEQFSDLRISLSVYGVAAGLFADRLETVTISTLAASSAQALVLGDDCLSQIMATTTSQHLGESVIASARALGYSLAAMVEPGGPMQDYLLRQGLENLAPPLAAMTIPARLQDQPYPAGTLTPPSGGLATGPLNDFEGRRLLSERELEIVTLTTNGLSAKEAGRHLGLSHRTVEVHRSRVFAKLGVKNVAQLTKLVLGLA